MNNTLQLSPQLEFAKTSLKKLFILAEAIFLAIVCALVLYMYGNILVEFMHILIAGQIKPIIAMNDGIAYFLDTKSFYFHHVFTQITIIDFKNSILFDVGPHGPGYTILYFILYHIFGYHLALIPVFNICITFLSIALLAVYLDADAKSKIYGILTIMLFFNTMIYSFGYMQETLQMTCTVIYFIFYTRFIKYQDRLSLLLALLSILLSLSFRVSQVLLILTLFPYRKSVKDTLGITYYFIFASFFFLTAFYFHYLHGYAVSPKSVSIKNFMNPLILNRLKINLFYLWIYKTSNYMAWINNAIMLSILPMLVFSIYKKSKIALGALLFSLAYEAILLLTYTSATSVMLRILGPIYYFNILTLVTQRAHKTLLVFIIISLSIVSIPYDRSLQFLHVKSVAEIPQKDNYYQLIYNYDNPATEKICVLLPLNEMQYLPFLPLTNKNGKLINYKLNTLKYFEQSGDKKQCLALFS